MKTVIRIVLSFFILSPGDLLAEQRWYTPQQAQQGQTVFRQNCAVCHGQNAEATANWKQTDANGNYPPPPLNGTAHAWHHDLELLRRTVREGGQKLGGLMPPFEDKLSDQEIDQAIAFFQSKWPDDLYRKWAGRFEPAALPSLSDIEVAFKSSITQHLRKRLGEIELGDPKETAVEDLWQVKLKNRYLYLIDGGRYALIGDLIDLQNGQNLTEKERRRHAVSEISKYRDYQLVVFRPASDVKTTLNVFTDTSCAFCQKLHRELPRLLEAGIQVRYLPYPRGGSNGPGYNTLKSVWCAADRQQAITDAKNEKTAGLPAGDCAVSEMVDQGFQTGNALGITGTPALFKKSGEKIEGYVPYQQLIPMLLGN